MRCAKILAALVYLTGFLGALSPALAQSGDPVRLDPQRRTAQAALFGEVACIPTVFVFGRDGRPTLHFIHLQGASKTHATLDELVAAVRSAL